MIEGGCFCGAVRFTLAPPVAPATRCHCTRCRKRFGGAGSAMSPVSDGQLTWTAGQDVLTRYGVRFGLGFCGTCGSTLVAYVGDRVHSVAIGALDDDAGVTIGRHIFVDNKASWHEIADDAPQHGEWPG